MKHRGTFKRIASSTGVVEAVVVDICLFANLCTDRRSIDRLLGPNSATEYLHNVHCHGREYMLPIVLPKLARIDSFELSSLGIGQFPNIAPVMITLLHNAEHQIFPTLLFSILAALLSIEFSFKAQCISFL